MKTNPDTFVISENGKNVVFNPHTGDKLHVNEAMVVALKNNDFSTLKEHHIKTLRECGVICDGTVKFRRKVSKFLPTHLTILPTFDCNLRCVYCYSMGGCHSNEKINLQMWQDAVEVIISNALQAKSERATLGFHGGGEPLMPQNLPAIEAIIKYFRRRGKEEGLRPGVSTITNGIIDPENHEFLISTFDFLTFSIDGDKKIQDDQRPTASGVSSYDMISASIKAYKASGKEFALRATVTKATVAKMSEITRHLVEEFAPPTIHFEPLFVCGRCAHTNADSPTPHEFLVEFRKARELGKEIGVKVSYSGDRHSPTDTFCGASGKNFFLTPEGYVTTCLEVCRRDDPHADIFFIGQYNAASQGFDFDNGRIEHLSTRRTENLPDCQDCIAKFTCAGSCLAKTLIHSGDIFQTRGGWNCSVNRDLLKERVLDIAPINPKGVKI